MSLARFRRILAPAATAGLLFILSSCTETLPSDPGFAPLGTASVSWKLGSLQGEGTVAGLGKIEDSPEIVLTAGANQIEVTCHNNGQNAASGIFNRDTTESGKSELDPVAIERNGKSPFSVAAGHSLDDFPPMESPDPSVAAWEYYGCPGPKWKPLWTFTYWDTATLTVTGTTNPAEYHYSCTTWKTYSKNRKSFETGVTCTEL